MEHSPELAEQYSRLLFTVNDRQVSREDLLAETGMPADDFSESVAHLLDLGLLMERYGMLAIDFLSLKTAFMAWLDERVDERIFFVEQVDSEGLEDYYAPLLSWDETMKRDLQSSDGLEKILKNGLRNYGFLLRQYATRPFTLSQFFNEFTVAFSVYDNFRHIIGEDDLLKRFSLLCDRLLVNPFAFFAFHTEYFPTEGVGG